VSQVRARARRSAKAASKLITRPTVAIRALPDFLIIGTQRGGTTSLYRYLEQHPAVLPAVLNKGVHYFDTNQDRSVSWYRSHFPSAIAKATQRRRHGVDRVITGEGSPYYLFHPAVPDRVAATMPDARFIAVLRDPIQRAYSHYQHEVSRGFETLAFDEALEREEERLAGEAERLVRDPSSYSYEHQHHSYVARGLYLEQIRRWHERFAPEQLLILDSTELFTDPDAAYRRTLRFLGLHEISLPRYDKLNAHSYGDMSPRAMAVLRARLEEPTAELFRYLGRELPWALGRA